MFSTLSGQPAFGFVPIEQSNWGLRPPFTPLFPRNLSCVGYAAHSVWPAGTVDGYPLLLSVLSMAVYVGEEM